MAQDGRKPVAWTLSAVAVALIAASTMTWFVLRPSRDAGDRATQPVPRDPPAPERFEPGATATITGGGRSVTRILPAASFGLGEGESLDWRVPVGRTIVQIDVMVDPGPNARGAVGAAVRHARVSIESGGVVVARGEANEEPIDVWSNVTTLAAGNRRWTFTVEFDGPPVAFRALWKAEGALAAQPLPIDAVGWRRADHVSEGLALIRTLSCTACHAVEHDRWREMLAPEPAPALAMSSPAFPEAWLREWVTNPAAIKPGSAMPALMRGAAKQDIEDVVHFVRSLSAHAGDDDDGAGERAEHGDGASGAAASIQTGLVAYHRVGCVACHGPLNESPGGGPVAVTTEESYVPLGAVGRKWSIESLREFLREPSRRHPSGRMPDMLLTHTEADAIARYLDWRFGGDRAPKGVVEPERVARGRERFASMGCAACHVIEAGAANHPPRGDAAGGPLRSTLAAPSLEAVAAAADGGCLAESGEHGGVRYDLSWQDRRAIRAFLRVITAASSEGESSAAPGWRVPGDELLASLRSLNCLACHAFHDAGGPEPAIVRYFTTTAPGDMGLEGRLPPDLSHVGARLTESWMRQVLAEHQRARPWLHTRMPRYDAQRVDRLPELFRVVSGAEATRMDPPGSVAPPGDEQIAIGRQLVGVGGLNCISCHAIAGRPSTGMPGPDLARMAERLQYEHFVTWLLDPRAVRPDTRMPSFFVGGQSVAIGFYEGDPLKQVEAIWAYLSQGAMLTLPEGLPPASGFELSVDDEPVVLRMNLPSGGTGSPAGVGGRVLLVGFPEGIHIALDPDRARLMYVWEGEFIDAAGRWAARAGQAAADPPPGWNAPLGPTIVAGEVVPDDWLVRASAARFRGYRLDALRRPTLLYDVAAGDARLRVEEQPTPLRDDGSPGLRRRLVITGPPGASLLLNVGGGQRAVEAIDGTVGPPRTDGLAPARLDNAGRLDVVVEVRW